MHTISIIIGSFFLAVIAIPIISMILRGIEFGEIDKTDPAEFVLSLFILIPCAVFVCNIFIWDARVSEDYCGVIMNKYDEITSRRSGFGRNRGFVRYRRGGYAKYYFVIKYKGIIFEEDDVKRFDYHRYNVGDTYCNEVTLTFKGQTRFELFFEKKSENGF